MWAPIWRPWAWMGVGNHAFRLIHVVGTDQSHVAALSFLAVSPMFFSASRGHCVPWLMALFVFEASNSGSSPAYILALSHFLFCYIFLCLQIEKVLCFQGLS